MEDEGGLKAPRGGKAHESGAGLLLRLAAQRLGLGGEHLVEDVGILLLVDLAKGGIDVLLLNALATQHVLNLDASPAVET